MELDETESAGEARNYLASADAAGHTHLVERLLSWVSKRWIARGVCRRMLTIVPNMGSSTSFCGLFDRGCVPPCMARPSLFAGD